MKIICFGDSVTRGVTFTKGRFRLVRENYPALLQKLLGDQDEVVNQGVFNDNSDLLLKRLDKDVLQLHPDMVLINIGGNDCNFRWDQVASAPEEEHIPVVPLNRYLDNIRHMVRKISDAGAMPVVLSLLPLDPVRYYHALMGRYSHSIGHWISCCGGIEHWHGMYNRSLKQLVKKLGIPTLDIRTPFKAKGDLAELINDDGLHPTAKGYKAMAQIIYSSMADLKQAAAKSHALT